MQDSCVVREQNHETKPAPRRVRCLNPFRWIEVNDDGHITPCCNNWFIGNLGSLRENTLEEIWNSPVYRELREAMYEGGNWQKFCNAKTCPQVYNNTWVTLEELYPGIPDSMPVTQELIDDLNARRTELSHPPVQVGLSCDSRCNLRCIMCHGAKRPHGDGTLLRRALESIRSFLPGLRRVKLMGDGEVFAIPETREFLFSFDSEANPETAFLLQTNGVLFTPEMWEKIAHLKIDWLVVSIDASTRETYEKIRVGGKWDTLMRNLEFLAARHKEGRIREMHLSMTVMRSNHRELVGFARLGKRLGVTSTYFSPVFGDIGEEQIFSTPDPYCLARIARQLRKRVMRSPGVDVNALSPWKHSRLTRRQQLHAVRTWLRDLVGRK